MRAIDDERIHFDCRVAGYRRSLLLAGLSFSAMLTILAPITIGAHIAFNQAWADGEGSEGGGGHGGGDGPPGDL